MDRPDFAAQCDEWLAWYEYYVEKFEAEVLIVLREIQDEPSVLHGFQDEEQPASRIYERCEKLIKEIDG